jgi:hypothetical protein
MTRGTLVPETVTLHVPFRVVKRGGRKELHLPDGVRPDRKADNTLVKALARAFRWKRMLESGEFMTTKELAAHEKIGHSYLNRVLRMTLLAPDIAEALLGETPPPSVTLAALMEPYPMDWDEQRDVFAIENNLSVKTSDHAFSAQTWRLSARDCFT